MQYFVALAEQRSFSRASESSRITQSTLSASIRQLEDILCTQLVDRSGRRICLTPAGEDILVRVREILARTGDMVVSARGSVPPLTGAIRLGVIPSIAPFVLPRALPGLRQAYPDLKLFLREDLTQHVLQDLRDARLDMVLMAFPFETGNLRTRMLAKDPLLLATGPSHHLANAGSVKAADLAREPMLLLEDGHCLRDHAVAASQGYAGTGSQELQASSMTTLIQMVGNSLGITLLPKIAHDAGALAGTGIALSTIVDANASRDIGLAWRALSGRDTDALALSDYFSNMLRRLPDDARLTG